MKTESLTGSILNLLLRNPIVADVETTISNKGNAFDVTNKLVTIHIKQRGLPPKTFTKENFHEALEYLNAASIVIGFNLKFDLHWLCKEIGFVGTCVWDCQLAEFLFSSQTHKYPALEEAAIKYGVGHKLDVVKTEYWEKGIDTDQVPIDILTEYGEQDVEVTWRVFEEQLKLFQTTEESKFRLFRLHCNDLLVLQEMEYNGLVYDTEASLVHADSLDKQVAHLEEKIRGFVDGVPINLDSRDHVSLLLYGGTFTEEFRVPIGVYKSGAKTGQPRYKVMSKQHELPQLVQPLKGSELKKQGFYSTEESTLLSIKPTKTVKRLIDWLLERSKLQKLNSTYLRGLPKVIETGKWPHNMIHSNLNQCVATTGRLSSTKPNQQNVPKDAKKYFVSRYGTTRNC